MKTIKTPFRQTEPSVAIIIAARNEEAELEKALQTVCNLDYSNYKIIVINDRSTDKTSQILDGFVRRSKNIQVINIDQLPAGWIGKTHALYKGFLQSDGEYLLFTDADVSFKPDTLEKAITYSVGKKIDHLVVLPDIKSRSWLLNGVLATFRIMFDLQYKPWLINNSNSSTCLGIGAFNFVKRTAYETAGTHRRIALHPNDDLELGYCLKSAGCKQDVLYGDDQVQYEWYSSLQEFIDGLMKNAFSSVNYNFFHAAINSFGAFILFVVPVPFLLISRGSYQLIMAAIIILSQLALYIFKPALHAKWWHVFIIPFAAMVIIFIMLKSAILTLVRGGIYWSGTFYPLPELKRFNNRKYS